MSGHAPSQWLPQTVQECHARLIKCYELEQMWRSHAQQLREGNPLIYRDVTEQERLADALRKELAADQLAFALHGEPGKGPKIIVKVSPNRVE